MPSKLMPPLSVPLRSGATATPNLLLATSSTLQVGSYDALTDTFTTVFDLNDGVNTYVHPRALQMPSPDKDESRSNNIRTPGETIVREQWKNRHITVEFAIRDNTPLALISRVQSLVQAIETPPYRLRIALPGASTYMYADVVKVIHDIPTDTQQIVTGALTRLHIDFECMPGLAVNVVTLDNLAMNPGFEQQASLAPNVFSDNFPNLNGYAVQTGTTPTVVSNTMTIPADTRVAFGSPAWGAYNLWQIRFQFATGLLADFFLHYTDENNALRAKVEGSLLSLIHTVAGVNTVIQTQAIAPVNGTFYWLKCTQYPTVKGFAPIVQIQFCNDGTNNPGSVITTVSGTLASDTVGTVGRPQLRARVASLAVGGIASTNANRIFLFGPADWAFEPLAPFIAGQGDTQPSGAWETTLGNTGNLTPTTYDGGPVTSLGAVRIDAPPAGTWSGRWRNYGGLAPANTNAMPIRTPGDVIALYAKTKSQGLGANASTFVFAREFDASGVLLREATVGTPLAGEHSNWQTIGGQYVTGTGCAFLAIGLWARDLSASGASANAIVWFDNVQVWNASETGQTSMPYCELRFSQAPAQLVVSGIQGDIPSPALLALGTYHNGTLSAGQSLSWRVGRRQRAGSTARLVGAAYVSPGITPTSDSSAFGGVYIAFASTASTLLSGFLPVTAAQDLAGVYHLLARMWSDESTVSHQTIQAIARQVDSSNQSTFYTSQANPAITAPFSAASTWQQIDAGQVSLPPASPGVSADPTRYPLWVQVATTDTGSRTEQANWHALLPVDSDLLLGRFTNPTSSPVTLSNTYVWTYVDGRGVELGGDNYGVTIQPNAAARATPDAGLYANGGGGSSVATATIWFTSITSGDPYLTLDPTVTVPNGIGAGQRVNQMLATMTDTNGAVKSCLTQIRYAPLYLYPRP